MNLMSKPRQRKTESAEENNKYSYSSRRADKNLNRGRNQHKSEINKVSVLNKLITLIIILLIVILAFKILKVKPGVIVVVNNSNQSAEKINTQSIKKSTDIQLSRSLLNSNKITLNKSKIVSNVLNANPNVNNASLKLSIFSSNPTLYIIPAEPAVIIQTSDNTYNLVNNAGKVYSKTASLNPLSTNKVILKDQERNNLNINQKVLPTSNISFIKEIQGQLNAKNFKIEYMTIPPKTEELDVYLKAQPYFVKFNLENTDARQQAGMFLATITQLSKSTIPSKYIDVRVDGRAYYQ